MTGQDRYYIERALASAKLADLADQPVRSLSGGEQQRAWLAVMLAQRSPVLLLDEPATYLDIRHQLYMMKLLRHCNDKLGLTIVIVLHDMNQALQYADEVIVMKEGRVVTQGTPEQVITKEQIRRVFGVQADVFETCRGKTAILPVDIYERNRHD